MQSFCVRLKHASAFCEFGTTLDQVLVDQLIEASQSKTIANKLLEEKEGLSLTFAKAVKIAEEVETNEKNASMFATRKFSDGSAGNGISCSNDNQAVNAVNKFSSNQRYQLINDFLAVVRTLEVTNRLRTLLNEIM